MTAGPGQETLYYSRKDLAVAVIVQNGKVYQRAEEWPSRSGSREDAVGLRWRKKGTRLPRKPCPSRSQNARDANATSRATRG